MPLDINEYSDALDEFLLQMEQIPDSIENDVGSALEHLCRILRIAKVQVVMFDSPKEEKMKSSLPFSAQEKMKILYTIPKKEKIDESRFYTLREVTGGGGVAIYHLHQCVGDEDWGKEIKHKVHTLAKTIFVFNGRTRVMKIAESLTFRDRELYLYNLPFFLKKAGELLQCGKIYDYTAVYFNLKRYSIINQAYGRPVGTEMMKHYVYMLQDKLGEDEYVCRIGGDNFICIFLDKNLEKVTRHLEGAVVPVPETENETVHISAYAGCFNIKERIHEPTEVMDYVSMAFHVAKDTRSSSPVFFNEEMKKCEEERKRLEELFPPAIQNEEFKVYYQPKVHIDSLSLTGAEALCRWFHNGKKMPPDSFVPILEQSHSICPLDFYMLEHVCADIRRWLDEGREIVKVSVNLSRRHLGDPGLLSKILSIVDEYRVPHEYIEIELTETTTDADYRDLKELVEGLREHGISTAVDDFGVGYSSINLLRNLPWSVLKVDKSFLPEKESGNNKQNAMLKHIIAMSQDLGIECIVEGVETVEHVNLLRQNNCFLAQGFYFDKPLPVTEYEKRLSKFAKNKE